MPQKLQPVYLGHYEIRDHNVECALFDIFDRSPAGIGFSYTKIHLHHQVTKDLSRYHYIIHNKRMSMAHDKTPDEIVCE
jgi:hypothetical protein